MSSTTTTLTAGQDIDYIQKDYNSSQDALITFANVNFGPGTSANRLWTDFNTSSFSRNWLELVSFMADVLLFYFDVQATQSYLQTATLPSAIQFIADQFGYVIPTATSASGVATFTVTGAGTIPRGFIVSSTTGTVFYLTTNIVTSSAGNYTGNVLQGSIISQQFTAQGIENESLNLIGPNVVVDQNNINPLDISPQVTVNGNAYTLVNTFIYSDGADTAAVEDSTGSVIGGGGRVFELNTNPNGTPFVEFGDGTFGRQLSPGDVVTVTYRTGGGSVGNIGAKTLTTLVSSNPIVSSVTNAAQFSGGADAPSVAEVQQLVPASLRTLERAVTLQDYSDILIANFPQVQDASASANTTTPGVDVNVYVVPAGANITNITANPSLLNTLSNFLDLRKMVTVQFQIRNATGVSVLIGMTVYISDTSSQSIITQSINTTLENYFSLTTGGNSGSGIGFATEILMEDISDLIKAIPGITRFEFTEFTYSPDVQQNVQGQTTTYDVSPVEIYPNVSESEWLVAASGPVFESTGTVLFHNDNAATFTYTSSTGLIQYTSSLLPETLTSVSPGDEFQDGAAVNYVILGVNSVANTLFIATGQSVNTTPGVNAGGSIRSGDSSFESYRVFKKINAVTTNLSISSLTDNNLSFSVLNGIGSVIGPNQLLDNTNVFIPGQYATGKFYLVDGASNIWTIVANDSDTITTSISAVNDASVTTVSAGPYSIVLNYSGYQVIFNNNIFDIQYNNVNTVFAPFSQFSNIGTIGNVFQISQEQTNVGNLGVAVDLISYNAGTQNIELNNQPDLSGFSSEAFLIDSSGQVFRITALDNRTQPSISYNSSHFNTSVVLTGSGANSKVAQGFKVNSTATYPVVSWYLSRQGNIVGNLIAQIVGDTAGLPNLSNVIATSIPVGVADTQEASGVVASIASNIVTLNPTVVGLSNVTPGMNFYDMGNFIGTVVSVNVGAHQVTLTTVTGVVVGHSITINSPSATLLTNFSKIVFNFVTPPSLTASTQYHLVLFGDGNYTASQNTDVEVFDNNTARSTYSYTSSTGVVQYSPIPGLSSVVPGNFILDKTATAYQILAVNAAGGTVTIAPGTAFISDNSEYVFTVTSANATAGAVYSNNGQTFTVNTTIAAGTTLTCTGTGAPTSSGTLTKVSGTGDATITFSAAVLTYSGITNSGSIFAMDNVYVGIDAISPTYPNGAFETYNGAIWADYSPAADAIFSVEGPNSITVNSNLTPVLGTGATISTRYYDDQDQISFILGLSSGIDTYASDVNALGNGTVLGIPDRPVDSFIFRTSRYIDDITNLRGNEIPQINTSGIVLQIFGGLLS